MGSQMDNGILILAPQEDAHAKVILHRLKERAPYMDVWIVDTSLFPSQILLESRFDANGLKSRIVLPGDIPIESERIKSVWWRRPAIPMIDPAVEDPESREFALRESFHALKGLWQTLPCFWVNPPLKERAASKKMHQLQIATECGFAIPKTLVTNNPAAVKGFWEENNRKVVCKQLRGLATRRTQTVFLEESKMAELDALRLAPVIFQEYVEAQYDLRITVIGEDIFAARIDSSCSKVPLDWRYDHAVPIRQWEISSDLQDTVRRFIKKLGLVYGAIDMRVTPEGQSVFLEINPSGQFLFVEIETGWPLSEKMAELLAGCKDAESEA